MSKRRNRGYKKGAPYRDARLFLIVTEGEISEKIYFEGLGSSRVKIKVIPSTGGRSAPNHIIENAHISVKALDLKSDDSVWLVIDTDRWENRMMASVARLCESKGYHLAVSNPCFEFWLFLHLYNGDAIPGEDCRSIKSFLRQQIPEYSPTNFDPNIFIPSLSLAVAKAKQMDPRNERWPTNFGSTIYRLFEELG